MSRPGRGCLTCTAAICDGCPSIPCTREERALLKMALSKASREKKNPQQPKPMRETRKTYI